MGFSKVLLSLFALCATTVYAKDKTTKLSEIPDILVVTTNLTATNTPIEGVGTTIEVTYTLPTPPAGETYPTAAKVLVKACYNDASKKDRPWRKAKDVINDDKQCKKKFAEGAAIPAEGESASITYSFPPDFPGATYFVRVFAQTADGTFVYYGQSNLKDGVTDKTDEFTIDAYDGVSAGLTAGVAVCSAIAILVLIGYGAYDIFVLQKRD